MRGADEAVVTHKEKLSLADAHALCDAGEDRWRESGRGRIRFEWRGRRYRAVGHAFGIRIEELGGRVICNRFWRW